MKALKSKLAIVMAMTMAVGANGAVYATSEPAKVQNTITPIAATAPQEVRSTLEGLATVEKIDGDMQITVTVDKQSIVLNIGAQTLFIHAETGIPTQLKDIKVGDSLYVYYSAAMTRSLPPQSSAVAIVTGVVKDKAIPKLMTVKEIVSEKENQISFLNTTEDMIVTVLKENPISPFKTKQIVTYKDVQPGMQVFVWYDIVLMSYPGQTAATKTVIVGEDASFVKTPIHVTVNGKAIDLGQLKLIEKNGNILVPLKAVSKALGFDLKWESKTKTAHIDNGMAKTAITVGKDAYYKASSKAIGLTASFSYGASPEIINGSMYVPVKLFNLLYSNDGTVKINGDTLEIVTSTK